MLNRSVTLAFLLAATLIIAGVVAFAAYRADGEGGQRERNRGAYEPGPVQLVEARI
jgi:hypothetical protein